MARPRLYPTDLPTRSCEWCGAAFQPKRFPSGRLPPAAVFARRLFCDQSCQRQFERQQAALTCDARFWLRVDKGGPLWNGTPCWVWTGWKDKAGYGMFSLRKYGHRYNFRAHRYSYTLTGLTIPEGLVLDHLCRRPCCVNPNHLEPVTNAENLRRGARRGPKPRTHCRRGHPLTTDAAGHQRCAICLKEANKRYRDSARAESERVLQEYCAQKLAEARSQS